jgi:hypothetical protein
MELVSHFYKGLTLKNRQMMKLMCNETFKVKDPHNTMECLDLIAKNTQN